MNLPMKNITICVLLSFQLNAHAVIHGQQLPANEVFTIKLAIQHQHWLNSINEWEKYESTCSAVIIGTQPLTVATAGHCLKEVELDSANQLPKITITGTNFNLSDNIHLRSAFYHPFSEIQNNLALDIAILVFDKSLPAEIKSVTIDTNPQLNEVLVCGFGNAINETTQFNPRCTSKKTLSSLEDFYAVMPKQYEESDPMLHIKARAQFHYKQEIISSLNYLTAINRLDDNNKYSELEPMPTHGDSGGPWLAKSGQNHYTLVAITSYVERFYNKNSIWSFFTKDIPLDDYPYIAYGVKFNSPEIQALIRNALTAGADISLINDSQ
jgi:secreted trypsin-like serine protease